MPMELSAEDSRPVSPEVVVAGVIAKIDERHRVGREHALSAWARGHHTAKPARGLACNRGMEMPLGLIEQIAAIPRVARPLESFRANPSVTEIRFSEHV